MSEKMRRSQAQERRDAVARGAQQSPRSGARWDRKNDARTRRDVDVPLLIENKRTDNKRSITLKADDLEALMKNAIIESRNGVLQFDLNGRYYYVVTQAFFETLIMGDDA